MLRFQSQGLDKMRKPRSIRMIQLTFSFLEELESTGWLNLVKMETNTGLTQSESRIEVDQKVKLSELRLVVFYVRKLQPTKEKYLGMK